MNKAASPVNPPTGEVGAVIAAAGLSSRMHDFKPMLPLGGSSSIQQIIRTFRQAGIRQIVVVTGHRAEELEEHLQKENVICLRNPDYRSSHMFDSAKLGFSFLAERCDRILFTPADIPLFRTDTVRTLLRSDAPAAKPCLDGRGGHPICLSSSAALRLPADIGEGGLKDALARCGIVVESVPVSDPYILMDMDTPQDYQQLLSLIKTNN